jgi:hypothetical protein
MCVCVCVWVCVCVCVEGHAGDRHRRLCVYAYVYACVVYMRVCLVATGTGVFELAADITDGSGCLVIHPSGPTPGPAHPAACVSSGEGWVTVLMVLPAAVVGETRGGGGEGGGAGKSFSQRASNR